MYTLLYETFNDQKKNRKSKGPKQEKEDTLEVIHGQSIQSIAETSLLLQMNKELKNIYSQRGKHDAVGIIMTH